ncbi:Uncharacterised protein [Starkeya nomas]|uniref:Uncharacterized protein n=1 Tax=Starkeya nomas TaxID=2666134 RepID=A0A5S9R6H0_9HYPH|nr:hypothetical protein [Starkeya nomas]CAA0130205.1 Uncharacterised protein [Starkeya nomas]
MLQQHPSTEEVRELLKPCRQLMERYLYTGMELAPEAVHALLNVFIVVDDKIAQLGHEVAAGARTLAQMEAVARDLDLVGRGKGEPPHQNSSAMPSATVLAFTPRLPLRPLFGPAEPGGAA